MLLTCRLHLILNETLKFMWRMWKACFSVRWERICRISIINMWIFNVSLIYSINLDNKLKFFSYLHWKLHKPNSFSQQRAGNIIIIFVFCFRSTFSFHSRYTTHSFVSDYSEIQVRTQRKSLWVFLCKFETTICSKLSL